MIKAFKYLTSQIKLVFPLAKIVWQSHLVYRWSQLVWIINGFITPLLLMSVWLTIRKHNNLVLNDNQIITYYLLTAVIFRITQSWTGEDLGFKIKDGDLSSFLVKPLSFWAPALGKDLGLKGIRLLSLLPFIIISFLIYQHQISITHNYFYLLSFVVFSAFGYLINFIMQNIIGLSAFWLEHIDGANTMYNLISSILSGVLIPLSLMPDYLFKFAEYSPFRFLISYPIQILMEDLQASDIKIGIFIGLLWITILLYLQELIYAKGLKKYTAVGI